MSETLVDPKVSRAKFDRQIGQYRALEDEYIRRGWWMVKADFPTAFIVLGNAKGVVKAVVFGVWIDFTNYDLWPPSVKLVDPFTMQAYKMRELPYPLLRLIPATKPPGATDPTTVVTTINRQPTGANTNLTGAAPPGISAPQPQALMQAWDPNDVPFLCLPGVREYHENPAHTGDSWLLHRGGAEGTLNFLLEQIYKYGVEPLRLGMQVQFTFQPEGIPT